MLDRAAEQIHSYLKRKGLTPYIIRKFRLVIYQFYSQNARSGLPWRNTGNPYHILVSEIMLQQTQIPRVLEKYPLFISRFPSFGSLARARRRTIYTLWQGLGYNRRALALKDIARDVVKAPFHGQLPSDINTLMSLPFVGQSTAGAVAAFAFHKSVIFIETNIRKVFIHFFFQEQENVADSEIIPLIRKTLDRKDPRNWYYALMDYGSALRNLRVNPNTKSTLYSKPGPFSGSNRQVRGRILRIVGSQQRVSFSSLARQLNVSYDRIRRIVDQLCKEGFIKIKGRRIMMSL